jgi:glycine betaine/choline ABC-type transport system substrate-binding protein
LDRTKALACVIAAGLLAGCSGRPDRSITVGSKNFAEQLVLGEIAAQQLENRLKIHVERRLNLGGTLLAHQALIAGRIDLYPEYTGTALTSILKLPVSYEPGSVEERVRQEYARRFRVVWMPPLGFDNGFAISIRGADARAGKLETLSDAASHASGWQLAIGYEFLQRPDGYAALMGTYKLPIKGPPKTMDLGLVYRALESNQANMAAGSETDGQLSALDVKVLRDDRHAFPPYQASFAVREAALSAHPGMREALAGLSGTLTVQTMQRLNYEVEGKHVPVAQVAKEFLNQAAPAQ